MNPFELHGPSFLILYAILFAVACGITLWLRWQARGRPNAAAAYTASNLDPFEAAYLSGGPDRAIQAAITQLVETQALTTQGSFVAARPHAGIAAGSHALPQAIFQYADGGGEVSVALIMAARLAPLASIHAHLEQHGLLMTQAARLRYYAASLLPLLAVLLLGIAKVVIGLSDHRPVEFLVLLCMGTVGTLFAFVAAPPPLRTVYGDAVLASLRQKWSALAHPGDPLHGTDLVLAAGLFGPAVVAAAGLPALELVFAPPVHTGSGGRSMGGFDDGGYRGGSSCGGGSSFGGGGGGGGCGG